METKIKEPVRKFRYILIDANNLFYRVAIEKVPDNGISQLYENIIAGPVFSFFERLKSIQDQYAYDDSIIYLLFDNPGSIFYKRREIDTSYKHKREQTKLNAFFLRIIGYIQEMALSYSDSYRTVQAQGYEADDLVKPLLKTLNLSFYNNCLLISNDLDWSRGITDYSYWYNHKKLYDRPYFIKRYGFNPSEEKVILWKSLTGDNSDCIEPGLKNASKEIIFYLINKYKTVEDLLNGVHTDSELSKHWKEKIIDRADRLRLNHQLVSFVPFEGDIEDNIKYGTKDEALMKIWFSVINREDFMADFKSINEDDFFSSVVKI